MVTAELHVPQVYQQFREEWLEHGPSYLALYQEQEHSFVPNLLPEQAIQLSSQQTLDVLRQRLGIQVDVAVEQACGDGPASDSPASLASPVHREPNGQWLRHSNLVGINVRTISSFWNVIKYVLTIPAAQDAIHLLPIWEPGVVGSLYGMSSWQLNSEFFSEELAHTFPQLDSVGRQLRAVVHILHAMGKTVGMDVIPHTDRFSEIVLANPQHFEWLQREGPEIVDHSEELHEKVQSRISDFVRRFGPAYRNEAIPSPPDQLFSEGYAEEKRLRTLFGAPQDPDTRARRRNQLIGFLHDYGYEPVPATMAPPYRGLAVDVESRYQDSKGNTWYDYAMTRPRSMSRVFGPLARYKLYGRLDDNANWEIDFDRPRTMVWRYVCEHYASIQRRFGFDFMRGDMSHVQMRPEGVPNPLDDSYDLLRAVKHHIQRQGSPHFAYFAETFLAPRDVMLYGDEADHLDASDADCTLGDLQSTALGTPVFIQRLRQYHDLATTRSFAPSFTVMTGDKDDPRFDEFYRWGSTLRLFIALFLGDMPSYMALGFETRDIHHHPAPNEYYTKLYVFQETMGPKATHGPYLWGRNGALFHDLTRLRHYADSIVPYIRGLATHWLLPPDATGENKHFAWTQAGPSRRYVFVANTGTQHSVKNLGIPRIPGSVASLERGFSTNVHMQNDADRILTLQDRGYKISSLGPGQGLVYRIRHQ